MFEDIKGVIKSSKSKMDRKHNGKKTKGQTMIYKVAHRKLKIEQNEPYKEPGVNSGVSEGQVTHAPRLAPVMLLLLQNLLLSNEGEKDWIVFTTNQTFYWSFVIHIFRSG